MIVVVVFLVASSDCGAKVMVLMVMTVVVVVTATRGRTLEKYNQMNGSRCGFRNSKSCLTNLLPLLQGNKDEEADSRKS